MTLAYYNENDPYCAAWLRNLIDENLIAPGHVDDRDIRDVRPIDLASYTQCHFFAGIAGWSRALRLAAWPDHRPVWTGSCPCQPFSQAGKRGGDGDDRHLWPHWFWLIRQCKPPVILGEQVASQAGRLWFSGVRADLETLGHACGCADLCAAGVSAPHPRQRLYWLGVADPDGQQARSLATPPLGHGGAVDAAGRDNLAGLVDTDRYHEHWWSGPVQAGWNGCEAEIERGGRKYRAQWRLKPGLSIVAHGVSARVGKLCAAGNAITPQVGQVFIKSVMDIL